MEIRPLNTLPTEIRRGIEAGAARLQCPRCLGGRTGELSLTVSDWRLPHSHYLQCWRASCGWTAVATGSSVVLTQQRLRQPVVFDKPLKAMSAEMREFLESSYGVDSDRVSLRGWAELEDEPMTLAIPIDNGIFTRLGWATRTLGPAKKRAMTYKYTDRAFVDAYVASDASLRPLVIVEDSISAARLSTRCGYNSVALLGTNCNLLIAEHIAKLPRTGVIWALDRDAFSKAVKFAQKFAHVLPGARVVCLDEDIKDMSSDQAIIELLEE